MLHCNFCCLSSLFFIHGTSCISCAPALSSQGLTQMVGCDPAVLVHAGYCSKPPSHPCLPLTQALGSRNSIKGQQGPRWAALYQLSSVLGRTTNCRCSIKAVHFEHCKSDIHAKRSMSQLFPHPVQCPVSSTRSGLLWDWCRDLSASAKLCKTIQLAGQHCGLYSQGMEA